MRPPLRSTRRSFLRAGAAALLASAAGPALALDRLLPGGELSRRRSLTPQELTRTLVVVFLRGGADGLNLIVPADPGEHARYRELRPTLHVPLTGPGSVEEAGTRLREAGGAVLPWALSPRAAALMPAWEEGGLALLPDVHHDRGSRSHFDSQRFYETGAPWNREAADGWVNRHLQTAAGGDRALRALSFGLQPPLSFVGPHPTLTLDSVERRLVSGHGGRNQRAKQWLSAAWRPEAAGKAPGDAEWRRAGSTLTRAWAEIERRWPLPESDPAARYPGADAPGGGRHAAFGRRLAELAALLKAGAFGIELAEIDLDRWDTHQDQDRALDNQPDLVEILARGLAAFRADLGPELSRRVVTVVVTEFGRTARENGSRGTDHGSAGPALVLGHPEVVRGRRVVHGPAGWQGLERLRDDRDLRHSADYRDLLGELVAGHLGNPSPLVFPGHRLEPLGVLA